MDSHIRVSTEQLSFYGGVIREQTDLLATHFNTFSQAMQSAADHWRGPGSEQLQHIYTDLAHALRLCSRNLAKYSEDLEAITKNYEPAEAENVAAAQTLKTQIL